jgi:Ca-activated chloride channel family protein
MSSAGKIFNRPVIIVLAFAFAFIISSCSPPAEKLNQEGNQAFIEEAYLEALELYQSAQIESPELAEPYFNAANTFYRQGNFQAALEQMGIALQYIDEESLAESSFYNLGNTLYNSQDLTQAVEAYTQSLLLVPHDQDAKYNLELALQQQQQQEQQEQQQEDQDQQEQSQSEDQNDSQSDSEEGDGSEEDQENQENSDQQQEDQESEGDQSRDKGEPNDEQQGDGSNQPQPGDESQDQSAQMPPPGQRMTEEQARQLLAALASEMETLQEHLGQYLFARQAPPLQDW